MTCSERESIVSRRNHEGTFLAPKNFRLLLGIILEPFVGERNMPRQDGNTNGGQTDLKRADHRYKE